MQGSAFLVQPLLVHAGSPRSVARAGKRNLHVSRGREEVNWRIVEEGGKGGVEGRRENVRGEGEGGHWREGASEMRKDQKQI